MSHSCQILSIYPDCYGLNLSYVFLISKIIILEKKEKGKKAICCPFPLITMNGTILTTTTTTTTTTTIRKNHQNLSCYYKDSKKSKRLAHYEGHA